MKNEKVEMKVVSCQPGQLSVKILEKCQKYTCTCLLCNTVRSSLTSLVRKNLHPNEIVM